MYKISIGKFHVSLSRKAVLFYAADIALVTLAFLFFIWIKPASLRIYLPHYIQPFLIFLGIWLAASIPSNKYSYTGKNSLTDFVTPVIISGLITLSIVTIMIVGYNKFTYSRMIVFGTIMLSGFFELMLFSLYYYYKKLNRNSEKNETVLAYLAQIEQLAESTTSMQLPEPENTEHYPVFTLGNYKEQILEETGQSAYDFMLDHIDEKHNRTLVLSTTTQFNVLAVPSDVANVVVNLKPINDIKRINKFIEAVNTKLPVGGLFIDCVITNEIRKKRILHIYPWGLNYFFYLLYYLLKRVFPKIPLINKFYFFLTNGFDRSISKAEAFGRLYSCGFEVLADHSTKDKLFFVARKITKPAFDMNPTYGPLISLQRMGKNGKTIYVYKVRTMHPYSEYIQGYVFEKNNLQNGGKFKDDFRISTAGRIMRKLWIDELPMLFNLVTGDLKLVGVRPLSFHYFNLYTKELQERRTKHRPGLIPPFYADMPETLDEIMASEMRYLDAYEKRPMFTDISYFFKAMFNILIKRKRSG
jgi:lipopolysaccharide/colanic/teichoic acid biosynthesis glycosyltransferase